MAYIPNNRTIRIQGFADFEDQLKQLAEGYRSDLVARNTLVKAAKEAMQPVLFTAKSLAKYDYNNTSGIHMKDTIRVEGRIPNARDKRSAYVNASDAAIALVTVKKSAVSLANEFSTKKMAARPFMRPALDVNAERVVAKLGFALAIIIPEYAMKIARKKPK